MSTQSPEPVHLPLLIKSRRNIFTRYHICHWSWIPWNLSFPYIQSTGQFTPKMKANAEPRLLSSLVWIDSGVVVSQHSLESFFHEIKCNRMTSFMEYMLRWPKARHEANGENSQQRQVTAESSSSRDALVIKDCLPNASIHLLQHLFAAKCGSHQLESTTTNDSRASLTA